MNKIIISVILLGSLNIANALPDTKITNNTGKPVQITEEMLKQAKFANQENTTTDYKEYARLVNPLITAAAFYVHSYVGLAAWLVTSYALDGNEGVKDVAADLLSDRVIHLMNTKYPNSTKYYAPLLTAQTVHSGIYAYRGNIEKAEYRMAETLGAIASNTMRRLAKSDLTHLNIENICDIGANTGGALWAHYKNDPIKRNAYIVKTIMQPAINTAIHQTYGLLPNSDPKDKSITNFYKSPMFRCTLRNQLATLLVDHLNVHEKAYNITIKQVSGRSISENAVTIIGNTNE